VCEGRCNPTAALVADLIESRPRIEVDGNRFTRQLSDIDITRLRALVHTSHVFTRMIARATVIREVWRCEVCGHERIYGSNDSIVKEETTP
jgi:hypothetical protein